MTNPEPHSSLVYGPRHKKPVFIREFANNKGADQPTVIKHLLLPKLEIRVGGSRRLH